MTTRARVLSGSAPSMMSWIEGAHYGPKCARLMGLVEPRKERKPRKAMPPKIVRRYMAQHQDPRQLELIEAVHA